MFNTKVSKASKAGTEVVKQSSDPNLTSLIYPLLQALDEQFLNADFEIGGIDQRKIFTYSLDSIPKIGLKHNCTYLMNPIISGLSVKSRTDDELQQNVKMSSSEQNSKIDLLDDPKTIKKKINKAYCLEKDIVDNTVLDMFNNLVFKLTPTFELKRNEKYGGNRIFDNFSDLQSAYASGEIYPADLKNNLANFAIDFLEPIRKEFEKEENKKIFNEAYGN